MPAGGLIAGGVMGIAGIAGQAISGGKAADAAQGVANAQLGAAQENRKAALGYAGPTAAELGTMSQQSAAAGQALQRQQALFAQIDPALMESGRQALQLMQGQNAATIAPMLAQRQVQRTQMMQQLQQQLGPGAASSSAGQQALANFDLQTSNYQAGLQQQALGTLLGGTEAGAQSAMQSGQQGAGMFGQIAGEQGAIQTRQTQASLGTNLTGYAGAPYAGALAGAQNAGQMFGQIAGIGGQVAGYGLGKMSSGGGGAAAAPSGGGFGLGNYGQGSSSNFFGTS